MPKGQFPKIKGTVCNVPVETDNVFNVLPRNINNGVIYEAEKKVVSHNYCNAYSNRT